MKKILKIFKFKYAFIIVGILFAFSFINMLGFALFSNGIINVKAGEKSDCYYAVCVDEYYKFQEAYDFAQTIQSSGGAGYIAYDGNYKVLTSAYLEKSDANSVVEKLKSNYPKACVYFIEIDRFDKSTSLNDNQNEYIKNSVDTIKHIVCELYNSFISLDKNENVKISVKIETLIDEINNQMAIFDNNFKTDKKQDFYKYRVCLENIKNDLISLKKSNLYDFELSRLIKYKQISVIYNLQSILNIF